MNQIIKRRIDSTSRRLCGEKLLSLSIVLTCALTLLCAVMFGYMGLPQLAWLDFYTAVIAALCFIYFKKSHHARPTAWILAGSIYLCLSTQIYQNPEYLMELGLSLSFVVIVMATSGAFVTAAGLLGVVLITVALLSPHLTKNSSFSDFIYAYAEMDVFSLAVLISGFGSGGLFLTQQFYKMHHKIYKTSSLDSVTQLPNRTVLEERLDTYFTDYKQHNKRFHVLFADAQQFSNINDIFGHDVGDAVLRQMGSRLQQACIELLSIDVEVFRFGGDEFVITIPDYLSHDTLQALVINLQKQVGSHYKVGDYELDISLVMGMSTSGQSAKSAKDLLRFADIAMYSAKASGDDHASYRENEISDWDRHFIIHQSLNKALARNELRAVFQPVYDIPSKRLIGAEALMRWNSAELGPVSPDEFIAVAESSGLISSIGQYMFDQAVSVTEQLAESSNQAIKIAVNVSPYQLKNKYFYEYVAYAISKNPSLKESLELEITESSSFVTSEHATQMLLKFSEMGLLVALDDYGTGATSFMSLQQGAFTRLKLDKSLLDDAMQDSQKHLVIKAAVDSALSLGMDITAEGIEVESQYELVKLLGCTAAQGYLFSRPLELEDFVELVKQEQSVTDTQPLKISQEPLKPLAMAE